MYFVDFLDISTGYYIFVFLIYKIIWLLIFFKKGTLNSFFGKKGGLNNRIKVHWRNEISHHFNNSKRNIDRAHWFWHGRIRLHLRWRNYLLASFQKSQKRVKKGKMALCNSDMFIIKRIHHIWLVMCQIQSQHLLCHIFTIQ